MRFAPYSWQMVKENCSMQVIKTIPIRIKAATAPVKLLLTVLSLIAILVPAAVAAKIIKDRASRETPPPSLPLINDSQISIHSAADVTAIRQQLIQFIWGPRGFPAHDLPAKVMADICAHPDARSHDACSLASSVTNLLRVDEMQVLMDNHNESLAYHFVPQKPNGRLVIVHQGHFCYLNDAANADGVANTIKALVTKGFGVLAMYMPHKQPDDCGGPYVEDGLFNEKTVGSPMKYFFEPIAEDLNYLKTYSKAADFPSYQKYSLIGLSGGGWTVTVYAAIDPNIATSIPVAGSIPIYLRSPRFPNDVGDYPQIWPPFYEIAGYLDLYIMGAYGVGRSQIQILNRNDNCCFGPKQYDLSGTWDQAVQAYAARVRNTLSSLGEGHYQLVIDDVATHHMISSYAINDVIIPALLPKNSAQS
jgi:hypothetical protein